MKINTKDSSTTTRPPKTINSVNSNSIKITNKQKVRKMSKTQDGAKVKAIRTSNTPVREKHHFNTLVKPTQQTNTSVRSKQHLNISARTNNQLGKDQKT